MAELKSTQRWLYYWAVLTVLMVLIQLLLGSIVTTFQWGMTDPEWPTAPWYLAQVHIGPENLGKLIEHTHRAFGSAVGLAVIILAVWLWQKEPRPGLRWLGVASLVPMVAMLMLGLIVIKEPWAWLLCLGLCLVTPLAWLPSAIISRSPARWMCWFGTAALAGVIVQGLFGGFRVCWHAEMGPELSIVHGIVAQVYFASMSCLAMLTVPGCGEISLASLGHSTSPAGPRRASLIALGLVFSQLILGALLRHSLHPVWQRLHLITAFLVVIALTLLIWQVFRHRAGDVRGRRLVIVLGVIVGLQILVGVEAWMGRFSAGKPPELVITTLGQAIVRTIHVLTGALILALTAVTAVWVRRPVIVPSVATGPCATEPIRELEGVA
jgi:heme a synthase